MISTRVHGILDYVMGIFLIVAPFLFGFADGGIKMWIFVIIGVSVLSYSLITAYERGVISILSMKTHLWLDGLGGLLLLLSPWIFGFSHEVYLPHLIIGMVEILAAVMMERVPHWKPQQQPTT